MTTTTNYSELFSLLSSMYLCKPTKEALANWRVFAATLPSAHDLHAALTAINLHSEQELEDILWEYTRLFIGPYKLPCPPLESVYTSPKRLMMQEAHDAVQEFYNTIGLEIGDPGIMADHVGAELNFMGVLLMRMAAEPGKEGYYRDLAERFAAEHLRIWIPRFVADLESATELPLYREVGGLTRQVMQGGSVTCTARIRSPRW